MVVIVRGVGRKDKVDDAAGDDAAVFCGLYVVAQGRKDGAKSKGDTSSWVVV